MITQITEEHLSAEQHSEKKQNSHISCLTTAVAWASDTNTQQSDKQTFADYDRHDFLLIGNMCHERIMQYWCLWKIIPGIYMEADL